MYSLEDKCNELFLISAPSVHNIFLCRYCSFLYGRNGRPQEAGPPAVPASAGPTAVRFAEIPQNEYRMRRYEEGFQTVPRLRAERVVCGCCMSILWIRSFHTICVILFPSVGREDEWAGKKRPAVRPMAGLPCGIRVPSPFAINNSCLDNLLLM